MLLVNLPSIPGKNYEILGVCEGACVYSKHFGKDLMAGLKNIVGGELGSYTEMIEDGKNRAKDKLVKEAMAMGADGVLNVTYSVTNMSQGTAFVILATGTAVKFV
ncbi:YbjQ family protein [Hathewaya massiliensis]|uniref:YbjQ family protein n=1 Tax=Hathewaya massiliensis TaxID=1964382 RepID=UPI001159365C|nr:YbjQ family protein [Hathewaya massiliensis]